MKDCVEELGGNIVWKEWNVVDNSVEKSGWPDEVEKFLGKIWQESCVEKWYGIYELKICRTKLDDQFGEQIKWGICLDNQVHKLGVKF